MVRGLKLMAHCSWLMALHFHTEIMSIQIDSTPISVRSCPFSLAWNSCRFNVHVIPIPIYYYCDTSRRAIASLSLRFHADRTGCGGRLAVILSVVAEFASQQTTCVRGDGDTSDLITRSGHSVMRWLVRDLRITDFHVSHLPIPKAGRHERIDSYTSSFNLSCF